MKKITEYDAGDIVLYRLVTKQSPYALVGASLHQQVNPIMEAEIIEHSISWEHVKIRTGGKDTWVEDGDVIVIGEVKAAYHYADSCKEEEVVKSTDHTVTPIDDTIKDYFEEILRKIEETKKDAEQKPYKPFTYPSIPTWPTYPNYPYPKWSDQSDYPKPLDIKYTLWNDNNKIYATGDDPTKFNPISISTSAGDVKVATSGYCQVVGDIKCDGSTK